MKLKVPYEMDRDAVRARKSPWIETRGTEEIAQETLSGLVRARGLKHLKLDNYRRIAVRARKSPWIETGLDDK